MILEKIKVAVETSTKVKFIASLPVTITIKETLPILIKKYQAVLEENYSSQEHQELFEAKHISQITKNEYILPLEEEVLHVLSDNDHLFLQLSSEKKEAEASKKERLELKKAEKKAAEKGKERSAEYAKAVEKIKNGEQVKIIENKKQSGKKSEEKSVVSVANIANLLSRFKSEIASGSFKKQKEVAVPKKKAVIIEQEDSQ